MRTLVPLLSLIVICGVAPIATAQSTSTLVAEGLSLPKDHQYEQYNTSSGTYGKVDVAQVPALVKQKQPVYDRTAKAWVYQSPQGLNPKYAAAPPSAAAASAPAATAPVASAPAAAAPAAAPAATPPAASAPAAAAPALAPAATAPAASTPAPAAPLVAEGLSLPKDHQYERYNTSSGSYGKVDVGQVPALVKQKQPIYDRTAKAWVYQSPQGLNSKYAAPAAAVPTPAAAAATAAVTSTVPSANALVADGLTLPRDHQYERYNAGANTYGKVDVNQVPTLIQQNVPIYDRTAKAWVFNTERKLDPRYAAAPSGAAALSSAGTGLALPKDHQYERYNATESTYTRVDVGQVPTLVQQKVPVYDRTAKAWVFSTEQQLDPRYAAPGGASGTK